jgi:hypothetical protein
MTSTPKSSAATDLDLSGLVEGEPANAGDVAVPLTEAETAIDTARSTLSVTANDTHVKNLDDALTVSAPLAKAITSPAGDEKLNLSLNTAALSLDAAQIDTGTIDRARLPQFVGTDGIDPGDVGVVPAPTEFDSGKYLRADGTWQAVAGSGTVTSVALAPPADLFTVTGSPVTAAGTLTLNKVSGDAARVYATPGGSSGVPALIALEAAHIPAIPSSKLSDRLGATITPLTVLNSSASSITISSISGAFTHLQLWLRLRSNNGAAVESVVIRANGDTTAGNYYALAPRIIHSATLATAEYLGTHAGLRWDNVANGDGAASDAFAFLVVEIFNYASTAMHKIFQFRSFRFFNTGTGQMVAGAGGGQWSSNAAITQLTILPALGGNWLSGCAYSLHAIG